MVAAKCFSDRKSGLWRTNLYVCIGTKEFRVVFTRVLLLFLSATLLGFLLAPLPALPAIYTVCASNCDYNDVNSDGNPLQAALNAAASGDILELAAGEVFEGAFVAPYKDGGEYITVRSSRWKELPQPGYRVNPSDHAALMPKIGPRNETESALFIGEFQKQISAVDTDTDIVTFDESHGFADGEPVTCRTSGAIPNLPSPLQEGITYYVRDVASNSLKLTPSPGGAAIDLTSDGGGTNYCTSIRVGHHYKFVGLEFQTKPKAPFLYSLVAVGSNEESSIQGVPHHIDFRHVIIRGYKDEAGPNVCLTLNGAHLSVQDSYISECKQFSRESKAISMYNTPGPVLIRNNYLSAASIGILTGGTGTAIRGQNATDVTIVGNHLEKQGYMLYNQGAGPPSRACFPGRFYRDTVPSPNTCENGACYVCRADGTWAKDAEAVYRDDHYLAKGLLEFKGCVRCLVDGNVLQTSFAAHDTGNTGCFSYYQTTQVGTGNKVVDTVFRNNWCKDTWSGVGTGTDGVSHFSARNSGNRIVNNLITGLGNFPEQSIHAHDNDAPAAGIRIGDCDRGLIVDHNTFRKADYLQWGVAFVGEQEGCILDSFGFSNNILDAGRYGILADNTDYTCGAGGLALYMDVSSAPHPMVNNVLHGSGGTPFSGCQTNLAQPATVDFVSGANHRLLPGSPFSASCSSNCTFIGTDGRDLGADIDEVEAATSGAVAGTPTWAEQVGLEVEPGLTQAIIRFRRPPGVESCSMKLFTNAAQTLLHGDTDTAEEQVDTRAGNVVSGDSVQFILGAFTPLTDGTYYHAKLRCGDWVIPFHFRTRLRRVPSRPRTEAVP